MRLLENSVACLARHRHHGHSAASEQPTGEEIAGAKDTM
jgi:hypothetical protein